MACDNTQPDMGLTDTCISIQHGSLPQWWLSPAITLNGVGAGATANPLPATNVTDVTFRRAGADCMLPGASGVLVTVYSCVPGLAMNPSDASQVTQLGTAFVKLSDAPPGAATSLAGAGKTINWTAATDATLPTGPGHKCLVAIACPDSETPDVSCFHQAGGPDQADPHYAQLNIAIEPAPMHRRQPWRFGTLTVNPDRVTPAYATLRAEADLEPSQHVMNVLTPALKAVPGYRRVASQGPKKFSLQLPQFPNATVRDHTQLGCLGLLLRLLAVIGIKIASQPSYETDVKLGPGQVATINLDADLSNSSPGDAHIFHLTHVRADGRVIGGLTVAAVAQ